MSDPAREGHPSVSCKGERLTRSRCLISDIAHHEDEQVEEDDDEGNIGSTRQVENVHEWESRGVVDSSIQIRQSEEEGDQSEQTHRSVDEYASDHGSWHGKAGVLAFFAHVSRAIGSWEHRVS